jgi:hypothetical protein
MKKALSISFLLIAVPARYAASQNVEGYGPSGSHCHDLWAGGHHVNAGSVCTRIVENDELHISYQTANGWAIHENFLWIGTDLAKLPRVQTTGQPLLQEFSHINQNIGGENSYDTIIPLQEAGISCGTGVEHRLYAALHPVLIRTVAAPDTNVTSKQPSERQNTSMVSSLRKRKYKNDSAVDTHGLWWMELELDLNFTCQDKNEPNGNRGYSSSQIHSTRFQRRLHEFKRRDSAAASCPSTASALSATSDLLTEDFLFKFHIASLMATGISFETNLIEKIDYFRSIYERFNAFDDGLNDAALVAKVDGTCFAVFRGTVEYNLADVSQNFRLGFRKVPETDCYVRKGYYNCYFTDYQADFENEVRDCVDSCGQDEPCELILAGASQGGGASVVAGIQLFEEYDPYVFTFGGPRTFLPASPYPRDDNMLCTHYNKDRHFHFILTDSLLKVFDPTPYYYAFWTKNAGREILFDGEGNFNDQGVAENYNMRRSPTSLAIHTRFNYYIKSNRAYENACLPAPARGWFDDHWCAEDGNCQASSYCADGFCAPRYKAGEDCTADGECLSDSCNEDGICTDEPKQLAGVNESCWSDDDCISRRCEGFPLFSRCKERAETGGDCNEHSDCLSGHCAGLISGKCT